MYGGVVLAILKATGNKIFYKVKDLFTKANYNPYPPNSSLSFSFCFVLKFLKAGYILGQLLWLQKLCTMHLEGMSFIETIVSTATLRTTWCGAFQHFFCLSFNLNLEKLTVCFLFLFFWYLW